MGTGETVNEELKTALENRSSQIHVGYFSCLYQFGIIGSSFLFTFWFLIALEFYKTAKRYQTIWNFCWIFMLVFANLTFPDVQCFPRRNNISFCFYKFYNIKNKLNNITNPPLIVNN